VKTVNLSDYNTDVRLTLLVGGPLIFGNRGMASEVEIDVTNSDHSAGYKIQTTLSGGIIMDRL
jgi:hypothetical protein